MEFLNGPIGRTGRLGILPGSFNPPTQAHMALAAAALTDLDEVVLVLPRTLPHKNYTGADFVQRAAMLRDAVVAVPGVSAAVSEGGLFIEIAQECRAVFGGRIEPVFICGRDAAERIVNWDYGDAGAIGRILETIELLVACREGPYEPPANLRHRIRALALPVDLSDISASEVRRRVRTGQAWEHLVPAAIVPAVREIYRAAV